MGLSSALYFSPVSVNAVVYFLSSFLRFAATISLPFVVRIRRWLLEYKTLHKLTDNTLMNTFSYLLWFNKNTGSLVYIYNRARDCTAQYRENFPSCWSEIVPQIRKHQLHHSECLILIAHLLSSIFAIPMPRDDECSRMTYISPMLMIHFYI